MELEKIFESILREGWDEDLAAYNKASNRFDIDGFGRFRLLRWN